MPAGPVTETSRARRSRAVGVEQVLEQPQLVVAADERRLERVRPAAAAPLGDDAQRPPGGDGRRLALEPARRRPRTRSPRSPRGSVASPTRTRPGRRDRLEPRGRVDEVARDHALVRRAERDRGLAGEHAGAGLDARPERP